MDAYLIDRLNTLSAKLAERASGEQAQNSGMAEIASALAVSLEALRVLGEEVNDIKAAGLQLNPPA